MATTVGTPSYMQQPIHVSSHRGEFIHTHTQSKRPLIQSPIRPFTHRIVQAPCTNSSIQQPIHLPSRSSIYTLIQI